MDPPTWDISSPAVGDLATLCKSFYLSFMQFDHHVRHQSRHQHGQWNHTNSWNVDITPMFMCFRENIAIQPLQFQNHHLLLLDINDVSNFLGTHQGSTKCSPSCFCFWKDHHATCLQGPPKFFQVIDFSNFLTLQDQLTIDKYTKLHLSHLFPTFLSQQILPSTAQRGFLWPIGALLVAPNAAQRQPLAPRGHALCGGADGLRQGSRSGRSGRSVYGGLGFTGA